MADYTVNIDLEDHKRGDKWPGIPVIGPVLINGSTPSDALARIRAQFVHPCGMVYTLDSDDTESPDAPITISNAATWAALVPEVMDFLPIAGDWTWDMEFWAGTDTAPLTLYKGVITIFDDVTKN